MGKHVTDTLGTRITQARLRAGADRGTPMPQTELARAVSVTPPTVSQWEADASEPSLAMIEQIAKALAVTPGYLAFGDRANVVAGRHVGKLTPEQVADGTGVLAAQAGQVRPAKQSGHK